MLMNGNKVRTYVNMAFNMNSILLRITSADSTPSRDENGDWFGQ